MNATAFLFARSPATVQHAAESWTVMPIPRSISLGYTGPVCSRNPECGSISLPNAADCSSAEWGKGAQTELK